MALAVAFQSQPAAQTSSATSYTFSGVAIGAVTSDRYVVLAIHCAATIATTLTLSATINYGSGALAMTVVDSVRGFTTNDHQIAILYLAAPSGNTTATIVVSCVQTALQCAIGVWVITGSTSIGVVSHGNSLVTGPTFTLTTVNGGVSIAAAGDDGVASAPNWIASNLTKRYDLVASANLSYTGGDGTDASTSRIVVFTETSGVNGDQGGVFVAFKDTFIPVVAFLDALPISRKEIIGY